MNSYIDWVSTKEMPAKIPSSSIVLCTFCMAALVSTCEAQQGVPGSDQLTIAEGFRAELIYEVPEAFGSWVSLARSPRGLIASDQYGKLYQITPASDSRTETTVKPIDVNLGRAQGLLWAFDSLYVVAHAGGGKPAGLFRVTDSDGDDELDDVQLLREFKGGGEHGPHAVILAPDKKSLFVCAGNHTQLPDFQTSRVPTNWNEDQLLRRMWDPGGHAVGIKAPGGWVCKTDPEGKSFELYSVGFRNQYDIAFNADGELFTYDADMEWDIGTPWYRPTRVCHVTSGSEFGWRGGNGKWPTYYPDSVPPIVEIGPGSPTGIVFGIGAKFPKKYQQALYIADWSFGFIYAIHLTADGSTYRGETELFCSAPALQVTDITIGNDGAMYFAIGGRRTQSALYRITAETQVDDSETTARGLTAQRKLRRRLEHLQIHPDPVEIDVAWQNLTHADRGIRYAARIAIEHVPVEDWIDRALEQTETQAVLESALALARCAPPDQHQQKTVNALQQKLSWDQLSESQRLHLLRVYGLVLMRMGTPNSEILNTVNQELSPRYPSSSSLVNRELARLLVATEAPEVIERTLDLVETAPTQEDQIHYMMCLRVAKRGWTRELREKYLQWFVKSAAFKGGNSFAGYLKNAREEFIAELPAGDIVALKSLIDLNIKDQDPYEELRSRPLVKDWTVDDLLPHVDEPNRDLVNGRNMFSLAQCFKCHRFQGVGGIVGPDLTGLSRRYTTKYLLETLIDPNKEISDQYQATVFMLTDGRMITGRVANLSGNTYMVQEDMIAPGKLTHIDRRQIEESRPSTVSPMPEDLLNYLTKEDVLDLLAYLRSAENQKEPHANSQRQK